MDAQVPSDSVVVNVARKILAIKNYEKLKNMEAIYNLFI